MNELNELKYNLKTLTVALQLNGRTIFNNFDNIK